MSEVKTVTRNLLIAAVNSSPITNVDEAWQVLQGWDALVAERDRYRDALEEIAAEYEGHMGTGQMLTDLVRAALAGEDT